MFYLNFVSVVLFLSFVLLCGGKVCRYFRPGVFYFHPSLGVKRMVTKLKYNSLRNASGFVQGRGVNPQCICSAVC